MLQSVKDGIESAKIAGLHEAFNSATYAKRSLAALASAIGETEDATVALISAHFPGAVRTTGRVSGKTFYSLSG